MRKCIAALLTTVFCLPLAATGADPGVTAAPGSVLPPPPPPFAGRIALTAQDSTAAFPRGTSARAGAPNVLLVLTDDTGFAASSTFGGPVPTPTLDQLAAHGLRYNNFHTTAICSPTRAALLTGRNHHAVGFGTITELATGFPGYDAILPRSAATLGEVLRLNGYSTAFFGKHHNVPTTELSPAGPFDRWPNGLGFEYFFGFLGGDVNQWHPKLFRNNSPVDTSHRPPQLLLDRELADEAIRWIHNQKASAPDKPFFVYYANGTAHAPHSAPQAWIDRFRGQFDQGWDRLREESFARQKAAGIIPASAVLTPRPALIPAWNSLSAAQQRIAARMMEVFAAMVAYQDDQFGRVVAELKRMGLFENTLILFIEGDNGASGEGGPSGSTNELGGMVNGLRETTGMMTSMLPAMGGPGSYELYPVGWAWATDAPFPWTKQIASHLGGTRNGLVVSWPEGIRTRGLRPQYHHVIDIMPTILDVIGVPEPGVVNGVAQQRVDGISMRYTFDDAAAPDRRTTQYYEILGNRGIYHDGWLANTTPPAGPWMMDVPLPRVEDYAWELYDLRKDFSQDHNVAARYPEKLKALQALWLEEAGRNQVLPLDNRIGTARSKDGYRSLSIPRTQFVYWGGDISVPAAQAPAWVARSFSVTADVTVPAQNRSGPLVAYGSRFGGWGFYLRDGRFAAISSASHYPQDQYLVEADAATPPGPAQVRFDFDVDERRPGAGGTLRISVNGRQVAEGHVGRSIIIPAGLGETFDIGIDTGAPVTEAYSVNARFGGEIHKVQVDLR